MNKIKIKSNSFELSYLDKDNRIIQAKKNILSNIISLIGDYSCFIKYSCDDKAFDNYNVKYFLRKDRITKVVEVEKFIGLNNTMFEDRFVVFYFMPNGYEWQEFISHNYRFGNIFNKYDVKLLISMNDLGLVFIRYNPKYDEQIKRIISKYNND